MPSQMGDQEVADRGVERAVLEGERFCICLSELQGRMQSPGEPDHRGCDIDPHHGSASLRGPSGRITGAGREIEHPHVWPHSRCVQQGIDELTRQAANE